MSGPQPSPTHNPPGTSAPRKRGRLNIFLGMAPGVGKTYAMLRSAQSEKLAGRDVVIGCLDSHGAKATNVLTKGLPRIPPRKSDNGEILETEMDLDAVLAWQPHLVVVDELAHANAPGSRHAKRYQEVLELLEAGIDVHATLNISEVASRAAAVEEITGVAAKEVVPDGVLDAAEFEFVDLTPDKFKKRLHERMAYLTQDPQLARAEFFEESKLLSLRDLTWRFAYERIRRQTRDFLEKQEMPGRLKSGHRLLAVISANSAGEEVLRSTRQLADSLNADWIALYVETPLSPTRANQSQVTKSLALAGELGAEVITTAETDFVNGILRVAAQRNVTQIIVEKSPEPFLRFFSRDTFLQRLIRESREADVHVVRTQQHPSSVLSRNRQWLNESNWVQYLIAIGVVSVITLLAILFRPLTGGPHAVALIFLLAVVVLGSFAGRGPTLLAAAMSGILWDFFILPPEYEFRIQHVEDALLFAMYFVVALIMGQLTTRIRAQQEAEGLREERATALYLLTRELAGAAAPDQIVGKAVQEMGRVFKAPVCVILSDITGELQPAAHPASTFKPSDEGRRAAAWAFGEGQRSGKFIGNLPLADALYAPLGTSGGATMGVLGLQFDQSAPPTVRQLNLLDAFLQQIALALERNRLHAISEHANQLAESERLSQTLLDSMSHEIRTPIAAIKSATGNLVEFSDSGLTGPQQAMIAEIQEGTERLNRLVGNVLDMTRLESGHLKPRMNECDLKELIDVCLNETEKDLSQHRVTTDIAPNLPIVKMDFVLMQQALMNLLSNAARHTPPGTTVQVAARVENESLVLEVADRGQGIRPEHLGLIFDKFYRCPNARTGGTGLGLSLVKGFVEAQGGQVRAKNRSGGGTVFTVRIPVGVSVPAEEESDL